MQAMNQTVRLLLITLLSVVLTACVADPATPELVDSGDFVTYAHPSGVFTLELPPEWVVNETSSEVALNIEFSPPNAEPLIGIYVTSLSMINQDSSPAGIPTPEPGSTPAPINMETLATKYELSYYTGTDAIFKEIGRDPQPDGSLRLRFVMDTPGGTTTHNDFIQVRGPYFV